MTDSRDQDCEQNRRVIGSNLPGDRLLRGVSLIASLCDLWDSRPYTLRVIRFSSLVVKPCALRSVSQELDEERNHEEKL